MIWSLGHNQRMRAFVMEVFGNHFECRFLKNLASLALALKAGSPRVLISEFSLEDGNVLDLLPAPFPCLLLTEHDEIDAIRMSLERGALEYLIPPVNANLLRAKVEFALERAGRLHRAAEGLVMNPLTHCLERGSRAVELTRKESKIVSVLLAAADEGVTRLEIQKAAWRNVTVVSKSVDVHLFNLRKKIKVIGVELRYDLAGRYRLEISEEPVGAGVP